MNELGRLEKCVCCITEHNTLPKQATHTKKKTPRMNRTHLFVPVSL